jgi:hypothetical protein
MYSGRDDADEGRYGGEGVPLHGRWTYRLVNPGEILEVDAMVVPSENWAGRKEAQDPSWGSIDFGDLVVAVKSRC